MLDSLSYSMGTGKKQRDGLHQQTQGKRTYLNTLWTKPPHQDAAPNITATSERSRISVLLGHASRAKWGNSCAELQNIRLKYSEYSRAFGWGIIDFTLEEKPYTHWKLYPNITVPVPYAVLSVNSIISECVISVFLPLIMLTRCMRSQGEIIISLQHAVSLFFYWANTVMQVSSRSAGAGTARVS